MSFVQIISFFLDASKLLVSSKIRRKRHGFGETLPLRYFFPRQNYNSVADYRSSRVDVVCWMSYVPSFFSLHDGITFDRFELQG